MPDMLSELHLVSIAAYPMLREPGSFRSGQVRDTVSLTTRAALSEWEC